MVNQLVKYIYETFKDNDAKSNKALLDIYDIIEQIDEGVDPWRLKTRLMKKMNASEAVSPALFNFIVLLSRELNGLLRRRAAVQAPQHAGDEGTTEGKSSFEVQVTQ
mmetsp:Transcript_19986/g.64383  ORF Transcript_19986/g.64383 Transcript_19986/m.64383 type:complete len:107 (-) Transcript_19986:230-550(-)